MAYLILGEDIHLYNKSLYCEILSALNGCEINQINERLLKITFESDNFDEDEFCLAMIKNDRKTKQPYLFDIIKASLLNRHLSK